MQEPIANQEDFQKLQQSGAARGTSLAIGLGFVRARTRVAGRLVRWGVRPNHLTVAGFIATLVAAACLLVGAGHHALYEADVGPPRSLWPLAAALFLVLAGACDMLDGAVARLGQSGSRFGGVLDSTLDRGSDIAVYLAMGIHFAYRGNVTYATLAVLAMCNGYMISYVKARAEEYMDDCSAGYWLRGERVVGLLLACLCAHLPAWLWLQATTPLATVLRRLGHAYAVLRRMDATEPQPPPIPHGVLRCVLQGYTPRGSIAYDIVTAVTIGFFVAVPWVHPFFYGGTDPLRRWLDPLLGG